MAALLVKLGNIPLLKRLTNLFKEEEKPVQQQRDPGPFFIYDYHYETRNGWRYEFIRGELQKREGQPKFDPGVARWIRRRWALGREWLAQDEILDYYRYEQKHWDKLWR